ncbi:unnamed protein product [Clonostachys rhizophaga]|uniref:Uncharacterized protein n=1 Tax=Clonostachys rhizophaga TaxID=160324 RepID=A0A9N9VJ23_9HYPO|nr:unnamed protein product [Clonostachys rhizophaga]
MRKGAKLFVYSPTSARRKLVPAQSNRVLAQGTLLVVNEPRDPREDVLGYIGDGAALPVVAALNELVEILLLSQERVDRTPHHHPDGPHPQLIPEGGILIQHQVKRHRVGFQPPGRVLKHGPPRRLKVVQAVQRQQPPLGIPLVRQGLHGSPRPLIPRRRPRRVRAKELERVRVRRVLGEELPRDAPPGRLDLHAAEGEPDVAEGVPPALGAGEADELKGLVAAAEPQVEDREGPLRLLETWLVEEAGPVEDVPEEGGAGLLEVVDWLTLCVHPHGRQRHLGVELPVAEAIGVAGPQEREGDDRHDEDRGEEPAHEGEGDLPARGEWRHGNWACGGE